MSTWYAKTTNSGSAHEQGLVIDEETGANIAVSYDSKHANLIAAAPDLFAALRLLVEEAADDAENPSLRDAFYAAHKAIDKAEGRS